MKFQEPKEHPFSGFLRLLLLALLCTCLTLKRCFTTFFSQSVHRSPDGKREEANLLEVRVSSAAQIPAEGLYNPYYTTTVASFLPPPHTRDGVQRPSRANEYRCVQERIVISLNSGCEENRTRSHRSYE